MNKLKIADTALLYQPRGYAYIRLSRHDLRQPGTLEEKFAIRALICKRIAEENGVALADEDIILEQGSGAKISTRPGIQRLLDLVRSRQAGHIVTPYLDRLLRGDKRDEQEIEDALVLAEVTVCHTEGDPILFNHDYDPLLFEVKSLVARQELRNYVKKRKETDRARLELNQRFRGFAPYGYRYLKPTFDPYGNQLTAPGYETVEAEWPTVLELWERLEAEPLNNIARAFNADKAKHPPRGENWTKDTLRSIARNPLYAGYQSQRVRWVRGKMITLRPDEFIMAKVQGTWETAVSLERWWAVQEAMKSRYRAGRLRAGALTGILYNWCGESMTIASGDTYFCKCYQQVIRRGAKTSECHAGYAIGAGKIETWAIDAASAALGALFADPARLKRLMASQKGKTSDRRTLAAKKAWLRQEALDKKNTVQDLMLRRSYYIGLFGEATYEETATRAAKELADAEAAHAEAEREMEMPDVADILPTLRRVQDRGLRTLWEIMSVDERHAVLRIIFDRIELGHSGVPRAMFTQASATFWPYITDALQASQTKIPPLRMVMNPRGG